MPAFEAGGFLFFRTLFQSGRQDLNSRPPDPGSRLGRFNGRRLISLSHEKGLSTERFGPSADSVSEPLGS